MDATTPFGQELEVSSCYVIEQSKRRSFTWGQKQIQFSKHCILKLSEFSRIDWIQKGSDAASSHQPARRKLDDNVKSTRTVVACLCGSLHFFSCTLRRNTVHEQAALLATRLCWDVGLFRQRQVGLAAQHQSKLCRIPSENQRSKQAWGQQRTEVGLWPVVEANVKSKTSEAILVTDRGGLYCSEMSRILNV
jgi:hypothetical protein